MADISFYPELANRILDSIDIGNGDAVLIIGGTHHQAFLEEIGIQVTKRGGQPFIQAASDDYQKRLLENSTTEQLRKVPAIPLAIAKAMDAEIVIEPYSDPGIMARFSEKLQARSDGTTPIREIIFGKPGKKWAYIGWPTAESAALYGVSLPVLEKLIIGGCLIDYERLRTDCERVMEFLRGAQKVHVTDRHGTDFWLDIGGRRLYPDDGLWSPVKEEVGDIGCNLPAGEVYVAPIEGRGEGVIYCPVTVDELTRARIIRGARLYFKNGLLLPEKCTAEENEDALKDTIARFVELDMARYGTPNALNIAELGIGLNPVIDRAIGYILTDEKIGGSVHVAFGLSSDFGGNTMSSLHWDFVTAPEATLEAEYGDGSRKILLKQGQLML